MLDSEIFLLTLTLGTYALASYLFRRTNIALLHPLITSAAVIILLLYLLDIPYTRYQESTYIIDFLLGPSVVALGYALYRQSSHMKANMVTILSSMVVGCVVGVGSVIGILLLFGSPHDIIASLMPKSVTTPIAISISQNAGGIEALTAVIVVLTGIFGSIAAPYIFKLMGIDSKIAQGLALGGAAHGAGTGRALELGAVQGAMAGLAIGLMGLLTALAAPLFTLLF